MLKLAVVVWIALWPGLAEAIIWEFDDGTTQGWAAIETLVGGDGRVDLTCFQGWSKTACGRSMSHPLSPRGNFPYRMSN